MRIFKSQYWAKSNFFNSTRLTQTVSKYPKEAGEKKIQGKAYIKFIVEKDGSVVETSHLTGLEYGCSDEAERVIEAMPEWSPGIKDNIQVRTVIVMPIIFAFGENTSK